MYKFICDKTILEWSQIKQNVIKSKKSFFLIPNRFLKHREPNLKCLEKLKIISALFKEFSY